MTMEIALLSRDESTEIMAAKPPDGGTEAGEAGSGDDAGASETPAPAAGGGGTTPPTPDPGREGGGGGGGNGGDDPPPPAELDAIAQSLALADAMKPIEAATIDLYSPTPDKQKARNAITDTYRKATADDGALTIKLRKASEKFDRTVKDMAGAIDQWITDVLEGSALSGILSERAQVERRLGKLSGTREVARANARSKSKSWADRHADWSAPVDKITAQIGTYIDLIDKLNADINNDVNKDVAMASFWFEVAPRHIQLVPELKNDVAAVVAKMKEALAFSPDLANKLVAGSARTDGSLYLIRADELEGKRTSILAQWKAAAKAQAKAEADFKLRPDDAASLKQRWDKLKGDGWMAGAKARLDKPAP